MSDPRDVSGDDKRREVPGETTGVRRRRLLEAAAGGFALAASGLFVPAWPEEATAGEKPAKRIQDRTEKRNRKQRTERDRKQQDRKQPDRDTQDAGNAPTSGADPFGPEGDLKIKFVLINDSTAEIDTTCFYYNWGSDGSIGWDDKTVSAGGSVDFVTNVKKAALWFDRDRHYVWAKNPYLGFPTAEIVSAGNRGGAGPKSMAVGDKLPWRSGFYQIEVTRQDDYGEHKVFWVRYNKA